MKALSKTSSSPTETTVLIGFADSLSAPEVTWSVAGAGFEVVGFARRGTKSALRKSRFASLVEVTDPAESIEQCIADIEHVVRRFENPVSMALDDAAVWIFRELSKRMTVRVAGGVISQAELALDKRQQLKAAVEAGFFVPATQTLESGTDLKQISRFPVILKPALAARASQGKLTRGRFYRITDDAELETFGRSWDPAEPMLSQPILNGVGTGLFGLVINGRVFGWSAHRRVRMMNPAGSGASACISVKPDAGICAVASRFLKAIQWQGMFMIELLLDTEGRSWFIELNGRAWGSMALARKMGFEYPAWTVQSSLDPEFVPSEPKEKPPIVCRHLGRELLHLAFVCRGAPTGCAAEWPGKVETARRVLRFDRSDAWYNDNRSDSKVFWAETWQTLMSPLVQVTRRWKPLRIPQRILNRIKRPFVRRSQELIRAKGDLLDRLNPSTRILFLCYGNINRSALAEQYLRQLGGTAAKVDSCGFHLQESRPIDPVMRRIAAEFGIRFSAWSSRHITRQLVAGADLIFAMEAQHLVRLFSEYPEARGRAFLLSCVTGPETIPLEIEDPFGKPADSYRRCVKEVMFAIEPISKKLMTTERPTDLQVDVHLT